MSTDADVVCLTCKQRTHLGQQSAGRGSFGLSSFDLEGRAAVAEFIFQHLHHDVRIMTDAPDDCENVPYERIITDEESLDGFRKAAAHSLTIKREGRQFTSTCRHEKANGWGMSVLEALGDYAVRQKLVKIELVPLMDMAECYRVNPVVNASKLSLTGELGL